MSSFPPPARARPSPAVQYADYPAGLVRGTRHPLVQRVPVVRSSPRACPTRPFPRAARCGRAGDRADRRAHRRLAGTRVDTLPDAGRAGRAEHAHVLEAGSCLILLCAVTWNILPASGADSWSSWSCPRSRSRRPVHGHLRPHHADRRGRGARQGLRAGEPGQRPRDRPDRPPTRARNASIPVITVAALEIGTCPAGRVIVGDGVLRGPASSAGGPVDRGARLPWSRRRSCSRLHVSSLNLLADLLYGVAGSAGSRASPGPDERRGVSAELAAPAPARSRWRRGFRAGMLLLFILLATGAPPLARLPTPRASRSPDSARPGPTSAE
jgi:hypothetical protein